MAECSESLPKQSLDKSPLGGIHRLNRYKSNKLVPVEKLRSKRGKEEVQLRKDRRFEQLNKRRNITIYEEGVKPNQENKEKDNNAEQLNANEIEKREINEDTPLDRLTSIISKSHGEQRLKAVTIIRKLLSKPQPAIDDIIETGVIPHLVDCVSLEEDDKLQMEAAWALTNVASGNSEQTASVVNGGCIPRFIQLMHAPRDFVREQVVWGIANISGDCPEYRDVVLEFGIVEVLEKMMEDGSENMKIKRQGAWLLSNLCRHKQSPLESDTISCILPVFSNGFLYHDDPEILKDLCWGLSYLTEDGRSSVIDQILESGILEYIIEILDHPSRDVCQSAVRFVGNITTGTDLQTQCIIDQGGVVKLKALLNHNTDTIQREACWALSNITAGTTDQKQAVINNDIVPILLDIISDDGRAARVKKEAFWAITNITEGATGQQISYLVGLGIISKLTEALSIQHQAEVLSILLDGLSEILSKGELVPEEEKRNGNNPYAMMIAESPHLVDKIESLQNDAHPDISGKVDVLLETYINPLEVEEERVELEDELVAENINNKNNLLKKDHLRED